MTPPEVVPDPDRYSSVVLPVLSLTFTEPAVAPLVVGFDVTVTVQFAPAPSVPGQLFVCAK